MPTTATATTAAVAMRTLAKLFMSGTLHGPMTTR